MVSCLSAHIHQAARDETHDDSSEKWESGKHRMQILRTEAAPAVGPIQALETLILMVAILHMAKAFRIRIPNRRETATT